MTPLVRVKVQPRQIAISLALSARRSVSGFGSAHAAD